MVEWCESQIELATTTLYYTSDSNIENEVFGPILHVLLMDKVLVHWVLGRDVDLGNLVHINLAITTDGALLVELLPLFCLSCTALLREVGSLELSATSVNAEC